MAKLLAILQITVVKLVYLASIGYNMPTIHPETKQLIIMNSILIAQGLITLIQVLFIARFHCEISKINGFTEPANTIRRITNPLILPLKKSLPGVYSKRLAAIIAGLILSLIIVLFINQRGISDAFGTALLLMLSTWVDFLRYGMFLFVISSWIQIPVLKNINALLYALFEPMLRPIQQLLPSFGGLDFSPIIFLLGLSFIAPIVLNFFAKLLY